jgi:hypothetical protein
MLFMLGVAVERNVSSFLFKLELSCRRESIGKEGWPSDGLGCPEKDLAEAAEVCNT